MARGSRGATVRDNPYTGPSKIAVPFPGTEPVEQPKAPQPAAEPAKPAEPAAAPASAEDDDGQDDDEDATSSPRRRRRVFDRNERSLAGTLSPPRSGDLSGALFAVIAWSWIVLPLVQGGPGRVRDVWRAKWLNKGPDGKRLA